MPELLEKSVVSPVLIGRADLLVSIDRTIERVRGGRGEIAIISGEAGIGKSRLVGEAKTRAAALDWVVLQGNSYDHDRALPYAPLLDLLRTFCSVHTSDEISRYFGPAASDLVRLLPELGTRLTQLVPAITLEPQQEKQRLFDSVNQFLYRTANSRPLLLVVEDLHWADDTSLEFLLRFARRITSQPILLLGTFRTDEPNEALEHFLAELDRGHLAAEWMLNRLSINEVEAMLRAIFDLKRPVRSDFLGTIYPLTEGNPFFIEEILKSLIVAGAIYYADGEWDRKPMEEIDIPRSVRDAVRRRMEQVSPEARQTLTLAAIAGRVVSFALLQKLTGMEEIELTRQMKELIAAQLLVEASSDQFSFRHALTREAVYGPLLKREQQSYHRKIAETLERMIPEPSGVELADLSYHFYAGKVWEKALQYSRRAGEQALALYAPREAIEDFTRALEAARQLAAPIPPALPRSRGRAYETLGDFDGARKDYEQALSFARRMEDGPGEWQALIDLGFLWSGRDYQQTGEYLKRATELAQGLGDQKLTAQSLNRLGNWLVNVGRNVEGLQSHREALLIFEQQQDLQGMADTLDLVGMASWQLGDEIGSFQEYQRAISLYREINDKRGLTSALIGGSHLSYWDETVIIPVQTKENNLRGAAEALSLARQIGWTAGQAFSEWTTGVDLANFGEFGQALLHAGESLRIAAEIEHRQWIIGAHYSLGHIHVLMLQPGLAIQNLQVALPMARELGSAWWVGNIATDLTMAYLLKGDRDRAERVLAEAGIDERQPRSVAERRMQWALGQLALARGMPEKAVRIAEQLIESAPGQDHSQRIPQLLKLKGEALRALNRLDAAAEAFEQAKQGAQERNRPPLLWEIHRSLGRVFQRLKHRERAASEFAAAREIIQSLAGTIADAEMRDDYARAAFGSLPKVNVVSLRRAESDRFEGLTAREREVARLLGQGKSNREIASTLILSERTVENYVGNILSKLSFGSRSQIAVWAVEKGLAKSED